MLFLVQLVRYMSILKQSLTKKFLSPMLLVLQGVVFVFGSKGPTTFQPTELIVECINYSFIKHDNMLVICISSLNLDVLKLWIVTQSQHWWFCLWPLYFVLWISLTYLLDQYNSCIWWSVILSCSKMNGWGFHVTFVLVSAE